MSEPGKELERRCTWPEHFYWDQEGRCGPGWYDMEEKGCPVCFWWTLCWMLADVGVYVIAPMRPQAVPDPPCDNCGMTWDDCYALGERSPIDQCCGHCWHSAYVA